MCGRVDKNRRINSLKKVAQYCTSMRYDLTHKKATAQNVSFVTTRGTRIWSPIQVRTPPNSERDLVLSLWYGDSERSLFNFRKMRKGNKERKNSLMLGWENKERN